MDRYEFLQSIRELGIAPKVAAELLSVDRKTVERWSKRDGNVPSPAAHVLRAWLRLHRLKLPWRPDAFPVADMDDAEIATQIVLQRQHALDFDEVLRRVHARGGPAAPWIVDLARREARLGDGMVLYFYPLPGGGFSPSSYSRTDVPADVQRDRPLLEDAYASIAKEISTAGLHWADQSA